MAIPDVCRLCLTKDNLVWIFDKRFESSENMKDVIHITTGVEMHIKDIISQKICRKCCQVTIKMFEFRRTSLKNDKYLREECRKHLKENSIKIPNTDVFIKSDITRKDDEVKTESKPDSSKSVYKIHPSVRDLFRVYPQIKLPSVCLSSHFTPFVSMPMDDVENYFKARNLDFNLHTKLALRGGRKVATKRTSAVVAPKSLHTTSSKPNINKIILSKSDSKDNTSNFSIKTSDKVNLIKDHDTASHSRIKDVARKSDVKVGNIDQAKPKSSKDITSENTSGNRKRKYPETEEPSNKHSHKKPNLIESLGLTPKSNNPVSTSCTESQLSYVVNTSVPLHICTICNSIQYSAKDLRRHQVKHLRCQFCKTKFRTLETKTKHIENTCIIKNMMKNLPDVQLKKIEYNVKVRRKYPECFVNFAPLKTTCDGKDINPTSAVDKIKPSSNIKNIEETTRKDVSRASPVDKTKPSTKHKGKSSSKDKSRTGASDKAKLSSNVKNMEVFTQSLIQKHLNQANAADKLKPESVINKPIVTGEIIEILSDDEDPPSTSADVTGVDSSITKDNSKTEGEVKAATPKEKMKPKSSSATSASTIPNELAPIPENVVYNTVSIVKPDIIIKNNNLLERIESKEPKLTDVKILKELLKAKPLRLSSEKKTQTELPRNESICVNVSDLTTELQNLKQQLYVYKIPVVIKNGNYNVTYNYHAHVKQPKKLCLWNDLIPVDIKAVKATRSEFLTNPATNAKSNQETSRGSSLPATSNHNLSVAEKSKNKTQIASEKSNNQRTNNSSTLPFITTYSSSGVRSLLPKVTERSNNETQVLSEKNINQGTNNPQPSTTNNSSGVQSFMPLVTEKSNNKTQISEKSNIQGTNNPPTLPPTATYNSSGVQSLVPKVIAEIPNNETQVISQKSNLERPNNPSILPSTATYNFPGVQSSGPTVVAEISNNEAQVTSEKSNFERTNNPSILPSTVPCNFPAVQSLVPTVVAEISNNEAQVTSEKSNLERTNDPSILPSTASYNFPGVQSLVPTAVAEISNNEAQVTSEKSNPERTNNPSILPSAAPCNFPRVQGLMPQVTERSNNETQVISEKNNIQGSILPSTATYNFPGVPSLVPQVTATTSTVVSPNTSSVTSTFNPPPPSIINMNPMLNNFLQPQSTTSRATEEITASQPVSSSPVVGKPIPNIPIPLGLIRVKNVWELS